VLSLAEKKKLHASPKMGYRQSALAASGTGSSKIRPDMLAEFDQVAVVDRPILIVFDSNAWRKEKEEIGQAQYALARAVEARGGKVVERVWPGGHT
jgi:hypothetical protein